MSSDVAADLGAVPVGKAISRARRAAGLTVSALAQAAGTSRAAIYAYESGERDPSVATALRILGVVGCTLRVETDRSGSLSNRRGDGG